MRLVRRWPRSIGLLAALASLGACSLLADFDVPVGLAPAPVAEAGETPDAEPDADVETDAGWPPNAVFVDSFETSDPTCGWSTLSGSTATPDPVARTGKQSCRLCATAQGPIHAFRTLPEKRRGRYVLLAWYRLVPEHAPGVNVARESSTHLLATLVGGGTEAQGRDHALSQEWRRAEVTFTWGDAGPDLAFVRARVGHNATVAAGQCLLVDDVSLTFVP